MNALFFLVLLCVVAIFNVAAAGHSLRFEKINPDTVDSLDLPKYLGLWYQMSADQIVYSTFEKDAYCATAVYGDNGDGTISVHNYATIGSPSGSKYTIDGYAFTPDKTKPGQLKVTEPLHRLDSHILYVYLCFRSSLTATTPRLSLLLTGFSSLAR